MTYWLLVVEDEPIQREAMMVFFDCNDFNAHAVPNGNEAIQLLRTNPGHFNMVISDMRMPDVGDGPRLLETIKSDDALSHLPVMMVSASFTPEEIQLVGKLGAFAWSTKPIADTQTFLFVIRHELARLAAQPYESHMDMHKLQFLIVDDFSVVRRIARGYFLEMGCHHVDEAEDGAVALEMLRANRYDFVLADINMPNMNGFELLKAIKADETFKHLPVLMVTAEARKEDIVLAAQSGAAGYILKPLTRATLEEKIQKILQRGLP